MNLILAWRNVWRNKTRSFIILASVALGLFAGIFVLGLYEGMIRARVRTVIDTEVAHVQVHHPNFKDDYDPAFTIAGQAQVSGALRSVKDIKAVAYRSMTQGMLATATGSAGVQINGIIPDEENAVSSMKKKIIEGDELDLKKKNGILIGKEVGR